MASAKDPVTRLGHILHEINGIQSETAGVPVDRIIRTYGLLRLTERGLQIISEAAKELPEEVRAREPDIPWRKIIGIGNILQHEYHRVNEADIRSILEQHLPALKLAVERLLADLQT